MRHSPAIPPVARRLTRLPPYLFVEIDALKERMIRRGREVIDMGVGDPDQPPPRFILQAMVKALRSGRCHRYPSNRGLTEFREAIARWHRERFRVRLDPASEILPLIGSKEGIAHLPLAYVNPGDPVWVPDPGYPPYRTGTILAGGRPVPVPLLARNRFLPDLESLARSRIRARLFFLNYPNNPTAAVADLGFFRSLVRFAARKGVAICHDAAYSEIAFDGLRHPSFLQAPGAKEVGIEFHSLSKTFNMTGWRVGWACGNRRMISALARVKSNIDSGIFEAVQAAAIRALEGPRAHLRKTIRLYQGRRDLLVQALQRSGWPVTAPRATFYLWVPVPRGRTSREVAARLLKGAGIVATPGVGFGAHGEGYVRFSLSVPTAELRKGALRLGRLAIWPRSTSD